MKLQLNFCLALAALVLASSSPALRAGEPTVNPTGTWKLARPGTNNLAHAPAQTLHLKLDGDKLAGTLTYTSGAIVHGKARMAEAPITEAKLKGDELSFHFAHPPTAGGGPNVEYTYEGRISSDTIKGTCTMQWRGNTHTRDWGATRLKE